MPCKAVCIATGLSGRRCWEEVAAVGWVAVTDADIENCAGSYVCKGEAAPSVSFKTGMNTATISTTSSSLEHRVFLTY